MKYPLRTVRGNRNFSERFVRHGRFCNFGLVKMSRSIHFVNITDVSYIRRWRYTKAVNIRGGGDRTHTGPLRDEDTRGRNESAGLKPRYEIRDISKYFSDFSIRSGRRGARSREIVRRASGRKREPSFLFFFRRRERGVRLRHAAQFDKDIPVL